MLSPSTSAQSAGASNWTLVRWLFGLAWRYRLRCIWVLLLQLVLLILGLFGLRFTGLGIDYLRHKLQGTAFDPGPLPANWVEHGAITDVLVLLGGLILVLAIARAILNYVHAVAVNLLVQQHLVVNLRAEVYEKLQRLSFRFFDDNTTGSIITRVTGDVQAVRMFVDQVLIPSVIMLVSLTVYIVYMAGLSVPLTIACLATTPLLALLSAWFSRHIQPSYAHNRTLVEAMVQRLAESIQGIAVIKGFGREKENREEFATANRSVLEQQHDIFWRVSLYSPAVGFITRVNMMILLSYGGWLVAQDKLALGSGLIVFAGLLEQFSGQVNNVSNIVNSVQQSLIGARRVYEIMDAKIEVSSAPDALRRPRLEGAVRFENAGFAYDGIDPVLRDIDLEVKPGQCVAILGPTGSGKSVLMSLIPRFYDVTQGRILIDGVDLRRLHLDDLRRNIGIVFQESFLFSQTVAANIAFGHPEATRAQVEKAARIAAAHEFVEKLPKGYDTILGESASNLSGGQRQRLAIARAVLLEPAILLLDDPTAAIDSETEHEIFSALDRAIAGRTTFIVAHRLSTLRRADFIIVMDNGRIVQRGTHEELMRVPGSYRHVASLQLLDGGKLDGGSTTSIGGGA